MRQLKTQSFDIERSLSELSDDQLVNMVETQRAVESQFEENQLFFLAAVRELSFRVGPRRTAAFQSILSDRRIIASARRTAAVELGRENRVENREVLMRTLANGPERRLFTKVVQALGKIGDRATLSQLEQIALPDDHTAREALNFSKSLIAYRLRLNSHPIVPQTSETVDLPEKRTFELTNQLDVSAVRELQQSLQGHLPALSLAEEGAIVLRCRSYRFFLVFTEAFSQSQALQSLTDQKALPLVLINQGLALDEPTLGQYLFTQPTGDGQTMTVLGTRPSGAVTYLGKGTVSKDALTFSLKSVATRYAPAIGVEGSYRFSSHTWEFSRRMTSQSVAAQRSVSIPRRAVARAV